MPIVKILGMVCTFMGSLMESSLKCSAIFLNKTFDCIHKQIYICRQKQN